MAAAVHLQVDSFAPDGGDEHVGGLQVDPADRYVGLLVELRYQAMKACSLPPGRSRRLPASSVGCCSTLMPVERTPLHLGFRRPGGQALMHLLVVLSSSSGASRSAYPLSSPGPIAEYP